jgi:putative hydrolase of the HAD superfamily
VSKPTPEIFAQALFQSGAKASESVMIGDDYDVDVMGAIRQGFHGIHFDPKAKRIGRSGIWRIRDLNQLPEMLLDIFS